MIAFALFLLGSAIGSFLLVLADRYMSQEDAFTGRSRCDFCKKQLRWYELIPYISFIIQKGRCGSCKKKISLQYPFYELLSGLSCVLFLQQAVAAGEHLFIPISMYVFTCILLVLIRIDLAIMVLPDRFIAALAALACFLVWMCHSSADGVALGVLVGVGFLYMLWAATGGMGIGFGDVKLMVPLGMIFGLQGTTTLLFLAFFIGGIVGIVLIGLKKAGGKTAIPFGPFLAVSALAIMLIPDLPHRFFQLLGVE